MRKDVRHQPAPMLFHGRVVLAALTLLLAAAAPGPPISSVLGQAQAAIITPAARDTQPVPQIQPFSKITETPEPTITPVKPSTPPPAPQNPAVTYQRFTGCDAQPCIALTFDDGPSSEVTPQILTILEQKQAKASFFVIGKKVARHEHLLQRMQADGFEIGNHTWDHTDLTKLQPDQIVDELVRTQLAIMDSGVAPPHFFRPPYGAINESTVQKVGLQTALWDEDPRDWSATDPAALTAAIVAGAKPGGVVDLHDNHPITAAVLPAVIDQLHAKNYNLVTLSDLMHSRARPGDAPFYGYAPTP